MITGCHAASAIDHLHAETEILPVSDHLLLLSAQYLASAQRSDHPAHRIVNLPPGPRRKKETLTTKVGHLVEPHLVNNAVPADAYKTTVDQIHTRVVEEALSRSSNNRVLGARAPRIDPSETSLSRPTRAVLAQLRSGHCAKLQDFQHRIGSSVSDQCPECQSSTDSVAHIFSCPSHPTNLTPMDLWRRPREVALFLSSLQAFSHLPAIAPLPPPRQRLRRRPPPEPPPSPPP